MHRNAALQLGLNPENLPLNLKNIGLAYNDYKEVLKILLEMKLGTSAQDMV